MYEWTTWSAGGGGRGGSGNTLHLAEMPSRQEEERVEGAGQKVVVGQPAGCGGKLGQGRDLLHSLPAAHFLPIRTHQGSTL